MNQVHELSDYKIDKIAEFSSWILELSLCDIKFTLWLNSKYYKSYHMANTSSGYELFNNYDMKTKQARALFTVSYKLMKIVFSICRGRPFKIMRESWPDFEEIVNAIVNKCHGLQIGNYLLAPKLDSLKNRWQYKNFIIWLLIIKIFRRFWLVL